MDTGPVSVLPYTCATGTPRAWKAWMSDGGTTCEPLLTKRSDDRSVRAQSGCSTMAFITAGTSRLVVGRQTATSCSQAPGSKRACRRTVPPAASVGSTWMHSPPTWNSGSTASVRVCASKPWASMAAAMLAAMPAAVCTAPLGVPVVPEV
jgi:hypothetical protein